MTAGGGVVGTGGGGAARVGEAADGAAGVAGAVVGLGFPRKKAVRAEAISTRLQTRPPCQENATHTCQQIMIRSRLPSLLSTIKAMLRRPYIGHEIESST